MLDKTQFRNGMKMATPFGGGFNDGAIRFRRHVGLPETE
jgi:hypothetical protein